MSNSGAAAARPPCPLWARFVATGFGSGLVRPAPGTWGSLAAALLFAACARAGAVQRLTMAADRDGQMLEFVSWIVAGSVALLPALFTALGVPASALYARSTGLKDPSRVVVDEFAGQTLALCGMIGRPFSWTAILAGFLLFRLFDIWKPWPIRRLEHLPGGWGIMADDLAAGAIAGALLAGLLWTRWIPGMG